jgi:glycerol kinase
LHYALEGSVFISGAALRWLRDGLGIIHDYSEVDEIAGSVNDTGGVYFVPAFVGLGAPHWDSTARGMMIGITGGTTKGHLVQATLDSIAYQTNDLLHTMEEDTGIKLKTMRVDGGITQSDMLMQQQADISQLNIEIPRIIETTAMGAALMAGYKEVWEDMDELKNINNTAKSFTPKKTTEEIRSGIEKWQRAVKRSKNWIE